jgi:hypothetical protein
MKTHKIVMRKIIICLGVFLISMGVYSQPQPPNDAGAGTEPVGGGAPIGEGTGVLVIMGAVYAWHRIRKNKEREITDSENILNVS